jgi:hypothetical protein
MTDRENKKIDPDNDMPENIKRDSNRDLREVPSSFNPGNQAGKGRNVEQDRMNDPEEGAGVTPRPDTPKKQKQDGAREVAKPLAK